MAIMKCTEGGNCPPEFDLDLYSGFDGNPKLSIGLPMECWPDTEYDGDGVFVLTLKDLLQECLEEHISFDRGEGTGKITSLLREYADKLDEDAERYKSDPENRVEQLNKREKRRRLNRKAGSVFQTSPASISSNAVT